MHLDSKLIHVGQEVESAAGDVVPPLHIAVTYEQRTQQDLRYFYGRGENPTREGLERCLAALEDAPFATVYSSGQAAGATALSLLSPGQRVVVSDDVYGGTFALLSMLDKYGIAVDYRDLTDLAVVDDALAEDVGLIWIETPTNPLLKISDVAGICARAERFGIPVLVDNTFASPVLQQPLALGADITLYSTTKFISGHSDVIGGALVCRDAQLHNAFLKYRTAAGNIPGPLDCYLVQRGLKTLSVRVERQVANTAQVVECLSASPRVGVIHYPGLPTHPQADLAKRQLSAPGSIVSFEYLGEVEDLLKRVTMFAVAVSLGGVRSLIESPALMTHRPIPEATRLKLGITNTLVRLSIGIEDARDLVADLTAAL